MRRTWQIVIILSVVMALTLPSCSKSTATGRSLQQHGLDLVHLMAEMASSETYLQLTATPDELEEILVRAGGGDYSQPAAVYQIALSRESPLLDTMLAGTGGSLAQPLKDHLATRAQASMASRINAQAGARTLAAASLCSAGKTFVHPQLTEATSYLYTFEQGLPALVSFIPGEDGSVSASGSFIFSREMTDRASLQQLRDSMAAIAEIQELPLENR